MNTQQSSRLFSRAQQVIPGGVNSPVRAFKGVGGDPVFFARGEGAYVFDADGNRYVDYVASWGPLILGHAHPAIVAAVQSAAANGLSFGAPTEIEIQLAEKICALMPNIEMVRMINSGTEATMTAIRLARGFTKRNKIVKFIGCYHGHNDALLVKSGSGTLTLNLPDSVGVPPEFVQHTLLAEFNHPAQVEQLFVEHGNDIAAIIVEPVAGNMNCVLPMPGFLEKLRDLCDRYNSVLIFDEVITGFRVGLGGAQARYKIKPDLTTLGKIIGGGMPVGAVGGRKEIMQHLAPTGPVYQAGTLSGNPVAMAAGLAMLNEISKPNFYEQLTKTTQHFVSELKALAEKNNVPLTINTIGSMFGLFFTDENAIYFFDQVKRCDGEYFKRFFHAMLQEGVYLAPSMYEAGFISSAHGELEINKTLEIADKVFKQIKN
jgi:glutamate-1-semialdehyde 2,1-aminomutase